MNDPSGFLSLPSASPSHEETAPRAPQEPALREQSPGPARDLESFARRAGRLAHEYNNALTALLGFADVLAMTLRGRPDALGYLDEVRRASEKVAELTVQLRDLSREAEGAAGRGESNAMTPPRAAAAPRHVREPVVLVVEEESIVRRLMLQMLRREGWRVLEASSGPDALAVAQACGVPLDLVITEAVLAGMRGRELAEQLRRAQPGLPVLFVADCASEADPQRLPDRSAALLSKPFLPEALAAKVRELLAANAG